MGVHTTGDIHGTSRGRRTLLADPFALLLGMLLDSGLNGEAHWVDAVASEGRQVGPGTTTWAIPLSGPGWTAMWKANRAHHGPARPYGYFQTQLSFFAPDKVSGTVTAVRGQLGRPAPRHHRTEPLEPRGPIGVPQTDPRRSAGDRCAARPPCKNRLPSCCGDGSLRA